jgi:Nif-specific regulatory protein
MVGAEPSREVFFLRLLELATANEPQPLLESALATIVPACGARAAYLELRDRDDDPSAPPRFWRAHGCSDADVASIRSSISRGIIAHTLAQGCTVATPSAVSDPSFRDHPSVLRNEIQAVLCAPIGTPAFGVVYVQGARAGADFAERNRQLVEVFARQLGLVADRLLRDSRRAPRDATAEVRKRFRCEAIIGRSEVTARMLVEAAQVAPMQISVLLTGPTGTGKSMLARTIAANSSRASGPYFDLNCANFQESLLESELFGAEAGAFTGATKKTLGKVAAARGGTLFLDEIGELSLGAQAKLLQLLQERVFFPVGSTTPVSADVRIISATHQDLQALVAQKRFRADLYFRLAVMTIDLPGLDQRREDIPELVEHLCQEACARNQLARLRLTRRALGACRESDWPGNIRDLSNRIEAAVARASFEGACEVDSHHVFPQLPQDADAPVTLREGMRRVQRRLVEEALVRNDWNIKRTADELDISRQHLHDLVNSVGLRRP